MKIKLLKPNAKIPTRGSDWAAGYDLYAANNEPITINPGVTEKIDTGIALAISQNQANHYFGAIFARSGLATKQGLRPANCVGVVDADYRGPIIVPLHNDSSTRRIVNPGDRIAQMIFMPYAVVNEFEVVDELDDTDRGDGGFGHTGV